jgi:hypothetical protein
MTVTFSSGLERVPTFLVPIINPPFADTARTSPSSYRIRYPIHDSPPGPPLRSRPSLI